MKKKFEKDKKLFSNRSVGFVDNDDDNNNIDNDDGRKSRSVNEEEADKKMDEKVANGDSLISHGLRLVV